MLKDAYPKRFHATTDAQGHAVHDVASVIRSGTLIHDGAAQYVLAPRLHAFTLMKDRVPEHQRHPLPGELQWASP